MLTESTVTLNSICNSTPERVVYRLFCLPCVLVLYLFAVLVDFQFLFKGKTLVIITPVPDHCYFFPYSQTLFANLLVSIYLISFVFVVLYLESLGASMMYLQYRFIGQVTGNLSRESVIIWVIRLY